MSLAISGSRAESAGSRSVMVEGSRGGFAVVQRGVLRRAPAAAVGALLSPIAPALALALVLATARPAWADDASVAATLEAPHARRSGVVLGMTGGFGFAGSSGYPKKG